MDDPFSEDAQWLSSLDLQVAVLVVHTIQNDCLAQK